MRRSSGQSLIEILIASTVAAILIGGVVSVVIVALRNSQRARQRAFAQSLIQDMSSGVRSIGSSDWHTLFSSSKGELYLNFDEGDDDRVFDPIKGNHGTVYGATWQTATGSCKAGACLSFDGTDDYIDAGNNTSLNFVSEDFTIAAWIKTTLGTGQTITQRGLTQTDGYTLMVDPYVHLLTHQSGIYTYCRSQNPANDGTWQHWAAVRDGTSIRLYRNGVEDVPYTGGTCNAIANPVTSIRPLEIGKGSWGYFNGTLDEVRIYNRALSPTEISALYGGVNKLYPDNASGVWQMKEGTSTVTGGNTIYTKYLTYSNVRRSTSTSGIVSYPAGTDDPASKKVTYMVTWPPGFEAKTEEYITQSANTGVFLQTDWTGGIATPTDIFFQNITKYETSSNVDSTGAPGSIKLKTQ